MPLERTRLSEPQGKSGANPKGSPGPPEQGRALSHFSGAVSRAGLAGARMSERTRKNGKVSAVTDPRSPDFPGMRAQAGLPGDARSRGLAEDLVHHGLRRRR